MTVELILGDCLEVMKDMPDNSVDTIITDPPYGLEFMGKDWDKGVPGVHFWSEMLRIAKPGACLMAMGGTRTYHRLASAIEDAGWRIIDMIEWLYGSGFPKSYDIGKGMDKHFGKEGEVIGEKKLWGHNAGSGAGSFSKNQYEGHTGEIRYEPITAPATDLARKWDGWGTALKPAHEPICVAYKPRDGTYVENALKWGVAGLWIDGGRVGCDLESEDLARGRLSNNDATWFTNKNANVMNYPAPLGRFPANFIHDGSDEVLRGFPNSDSGGPARHPDRYSRASDKTEGWGNIGIYGDIGGYPDSGSAARFFYCAKASRSERNAGLEGMEERDGGHYAQDEWSRNHMGNKPDAERQPVQNHHPTVKPIELMRYLVRLTKTPTGGVVLDPFMGSGTTGIACVNEGRDFIGIEQSEEYLEIARRRIEYAQKQMQPRLI